MCIRDSTNIKGIHFHSLCEQNFDALENTWNKIWPYLKNVVKNLEWINLGGGHHITRSDYNLNKLTNFDIYSVEYARQVPRAFLDFIFCFLPHFALMHWLNRWFQKHLN